MISNAQVIQLLISVAVGGLMVVSQLLDIRKKLATEKELLNSLRASFLVRNWLLLLAMALGVAGMLSIALGPVTQSSVLFCVLGGVLTAASTAALFVVEAVRLTSKHFWDALALQANAQHESTQRIVSVLEVVALPAKHSADKPNG